MSTVNLKSSLSGLALGIIVAAAPVMAFAEDNPLPVVNYSQIPEPNATYPFMSNDIDIDEALSLFGKNLRIGIEIADDVDGQIMSSWSAPNTRLEYLEALALEFDFVWYFDGRTLRISSVGAIETEILPLKNTDGVAVVNILQELDIYQEKFTHRSDIRNQTFLVSGPVDYVELVKKAVTAVEDSQQRPITLIRGTVSDISTPSQVLGATDTETAGSE